MSDPVHGHSGEMCLTLVSNGSSCRPVTHTRSLTMLTDTKLREFKPREDYLLVVGEKAFANVSVLGVY